jgi:hypothetical protein
MKMTLAEIRNNNKEWFSRGSMKFFNTKIESQPNKNNMFITSERMELNQPKRYTIRVCTEEGIRNVGEFQQYKTLDAAKAARNLL